MTVLAYSYNNTTYIPSKNLMIASGKATHPQREIDILDSEIQKIWELRLNYNLECYGQKKEFNDQELDATIKIWGLKKSQLPSDKIDELNTVTQKYEDLDPYRHGTHHGSYELKGDKEKREVYKTKMNEILKKLF